MDRAYGSVPVKDPILYEDNRYMTYDEDHIPETPFSINFDKAELTRKAWTERMETRVLDLYDDGSAFNEIAFQCRINVKRVQAKIEELTCTNVPKRRPSRKRKREHIEEVQSSPEIKEKRKSLEIVKKKRGPGRPPKSPRKKTRSRKAAKAKTTSNIKDYGAINAFGENGSSSA